VKRTPIIDHDTGEPAVFEPGNLLDGARRQKGLPERGVPVGCVLDMDGELVERLVASGRADVDPAWPCFHTRLYRWRVGDAEVGIVGGTVGAPFAVLVAEELFASGCEALVTMSSAGLIASGTAPPLFVLVERALRDEGTSYHYLPPARYAQADVPLTDAVSRALAGMARPLLRGASWTTDAPFRESASLLAMGRALGRPVICLAHVTNTMATRPEDFEKGGHDGQEESLEVCARAVAAAVAHVRSTRARREGTQP
jgi:hypothetical protein